MARGLPMLPLFLLAFRIGTVLSTASSENLFEVVQNAEDDASRFSVYLGDIQVIEHTAQDPFLYVGKGTSEFINREGHFDIQHYTERRVPTSSVSIVKEETSTAITLNVNGDTENVIVVRLTSTDKSDLRMDFEEFPSEAYDRAWVRVRASEDERVYGGGEQFTHFELRGRVFPVWTREQGVGRDKNTPVTYFADAVGNGKGGDYHWSYFPQASFVSSRRFSCFMEGSNYMEMDFRQASVHEVMVLSAPGPLHLSRAASMRDLVVRGAELWGRQTLPLPAWLHDGVILGVQGGTERMLRVLRESQAEGLPVNGLWIQDWSGHIFTSFGKRVFWNWEWNPEQYPDLDKHIKSLKDEGVRLLCYISPHINARGRLFAEAERRGHFARDAAGRTQLIDMGEFDVGTVDLTSPDARTWYKGVIKRNIIEFGFGGWMADFGEYIPTDMVFSSGETGQTVHNKFAALWAQVNREAVEEAGAQGEVFYYMRAGGSGASQPHLMAMWAGDQNVDWSVGDGLPSVVPAALSLGMSGVSRVYFDIGGYTTIDAKAPFVQHGEEVSVRMVRTKELFLRSAELAVFTPIMRTHEGNKPDSNYQVYADPPGLRAFAVLVRMFRALTPYRQHLLEETAATGLPCQRPLFLHFDDEQAYDISYQYLYGEHLLVAPVLTPNTTHKELYLPGPDTYWVHLFSGKDYRGGQMVTVAAPIGQPPVFYQKASKFAGVFSEVGRIGLGLDGEDDGGREEL